MPIVPCYTNGTGWGYIRLEVRSSLDVLTTRDENPYVFLALRDTLWRLLTTPYRPEPTLRTFASCAQTQENVKAHVTVTVLDAIESTRFFGVPLARRVIQPVYLRIENRSDRLIRLQLVRIDPNYYTPLEAAGVNHFSIVKRLSAFGLMGWLFLPLFALLPFKLITAYRANRRMDEFFRAQSFHLRPIPPGGVTEGFVFTSFDAGTKIVHISLHSTGDMMDITTGRIDAHGTAETDTEFTFSIPVPGIAVDFLRRDFEIMVPPGSRIECDVPLLARLLSQMPATTGNAKGTRDGDPANLVVVGDFEMLLGAFAALGRERGHHVRHLLEDDAVVSARIALPLFAGQRAVHVRTQPGYRAATEPQVDQRAAPLAAVAHTAVLSGQKRLGRASEPRYRRALYSQNVEPNDSSRRPGRG